MKSIDTAESTAVARIAGRARKAFRHMAFANRSVFTRVAVPRRQADFLRNLSPAQRAQ